MSGSGPDRRALLAGLGGALVARWLAGCDRLVVLDGLVAGALEPITPTDRFYVYQVRGVPDVDPPTHVITVADDDGPLATFDLAWLEGRAARAREHTLACVGSRPTTQQIGNAVWEGLPLAELFDALGVEVPADAVAIVLTGADAYTATVPLSDLTEAPLWLVWRMNGEPLPLAHGAPARVLVPGRYGMKNVKWPAEIRLARELEPSFWSWSGWSEEAPYRPHTYVASPPDGLEVPPGTRVRFVGTAFAGEDPVVRVEVSVDGETWREADLDYAPGPGVWVLWSFAWTVPAGVHTVQARCVTASGARSSASSEGTTPLAGYDGSMSVVVRA